MTNFFEMLVKVFKQYLGSKSGAGVEIWGQNNIARNETDLWSAFLHALDEVAYE
jgi:hypothetical protein